MTTRQKIPRRSSRLVAAAESRAENDQNSEDEYLNSRVDLPYDVLTIIFKNLNAKDLYSAARVCRSWSDAANNEKRLRSIAPFTMLCSLESSWRDICPDKPLINNLRTKPMLSFMFTRPFDENHPSVTENNVDCPCRILPSNCPHITVGNHGIVKDQFESDDLQKAVYMLLPECPNVTIETICIPLSNVKGYYSFSSRRETENSESNLEKLRKCSSAKNKVKCFIILSSYEFPAETSVLRCVPRDSQRTLSGGVARNLTVCKNTKKEKYCSKPMASVAVLISGPSVSSWSVVLKKTLDTKEKIEAKLAKLKKRVQLKNHSLGFIFACQGRGEYMFNEPNVESTIFKKLFPTIPLVGCFGCGEYGDSSIDHLTNRIHVYSTVFMIVTYS